MNPTSDDYDSPWKDVLDAYFADFMALFLPDAHAGIDWSRGWESLDQELSRITPDADTGKRLADKLIKVWRGDGAEQWVYIHVLAHLDTLRTRRDPGERKQRKLELVKGLYRKGFQRGDILALFRFIDWLLALPPALALILQAGTERVRGDHEQTLHHLHRARWYPAG